MASPSSSAASPLTADWVILPGLTLLPADYAALAAALPGEVRILDTFEAALTGDNTALRAAIGPIGTSTTLIGHSMGGLAALEWLWADSTGVVRVVLLDTSLPDDPVTGPMLPGRLGHRVGRALVGQLSRLPPLARLLGRAGRRQLLVLYGGLPDELDAAVIDRTFGHRQGLTTVWDQVCERFTLQLRVAALLQAAPPPGSIPIISVHSGTAPQPARAAQQAFAARLGATAVEVPYGHLFAMREPAVVAGLLLADSPGFG